jgi:hypothetical protein
MENAPQEQKCRRRADRHPLPVELQLQTANGDVTAIIRDVSLEHKEVSGFIAIGILHNDPLPLHETLKCRTDSITDVLQKESHLTLMWTRDFGTDGYLSGGKLFETGADDDHDAKRQDSKSINLHSTSDN